MDIDIEQLKNTHLKRQNSASNPQYSVWVSANAGAGKTHILVERIIRLLLPPYNCAPHKILCITYTKAAATEMTERLFQRLGSWISKTNQDLSQEMANMMGKLPSETEMITARRLFARALESPGGLKIQTIHGFCEQILRRFPIESGFPKDFTLLSDTQLRKLYMDALEYLSQHALTNPSSQLNGAFEVIAQHYSFQSLVDLLINSRKIYDMMHHQQVPFWDNDRLCQHLNLPIGCSLEDICADFGDLIDDVKISAAISAFQSGSVTEQKKAEKLRHIQIKGYDDFTLLQDFFMDSKKEKLLSREKFITKKTAQNFPEITDYILSLYDAFAKLNIDYNGFNIYNLTKNISFILLAAYEYVAQQKQTQSVCDFDDIIIKCRDLLSDKAVSPWVLWKLDGGIDHILVDEAQDTSAEQWDIVRALAQEFFVGEGAQDKHRTIFAVGDEKQSIYGFQGAAPEKMAQNADFFADAAQYAHAQWRVEYLRGSFRSSPAIMKFVDHVFQSDAASGVLFGNAEKIEHYAVANKGPGYIEIMPPVVPVQEDVPNPWDTPLDAPTETNAAAINAQNIAYKIQKLLQSSDCLPSTGRPAEPQDIMILLQRRDSTMRHLMRILKRMNIPISGLDRINLLEEVAILDLLAVIDFVLFPDDDLVLAQILRSPLCTVTEEDLFELAHNRSGKLWQSLTARHGENPRFEQAYLFLSQLLKRSDYESPYDFLNYILENQQGRKKFIARLGTDCIDALDEILNKSIDFVMDNSPSLQKFAHFIRMSSGSEKREIDANSDKVQIMTVHGSKGLEAPIVFLPNCCDMPRTNADLFKRFVVTSDLIPMIIKEGKQHPAAIDHKDFLRKKDEDEHRRLLYVALTRAKDQLFMSGKLKKSRSNAHGEDAAKATRPKIPENSWYDYCVKGILSLEGADVIEHSDHPFATYIYRDIAHDGGIEATTQAVQSQTDDVQDSDLENLPALPDLPDWAHQPPFNHQAETTRKFIAPSQAMSQAMSQVAAQATAQMPSNISNLNIEARMRGITIHRLLELLVNIKPEKRRQAAEKYLKNQQFETHQMRSYLQEIFNLIDHPEYSILFSSNGLSEVPIVGHLKNAFNIGVSGQIDRMVITPDKVIIMDYKTDRYLKEASQLSYQYILQMAFYREALKQIYRDKQIECLIVATAQPVIIPITSSILDAAFNKYCQKYKTA